MNRKLKMITVDVRLPSDKNYIVLIKGVDRVLEIIPPLTGDISRLVRKRQKNELAAALFVAKLFGLHKEGCTDRLVCNQISDERFHCNIVSRYVVPPLGGIFWRVKVTL